MYVLLYNTYKSTALWFWFYIRPIVKWFLNRFTGLCELQRICYGAPIGAPRALRIEESLTKSRTDGLRKMLKKLDDALVIQPIGYWNKDRFHKIIVREASGMVIREKKINLGCHPDFERLFEDCVEKIWGYRKLNIEIDKLRAAQYDCDNRDHEEKLFELWNLLMPHEPLEHRITKRWQDIGFQGDDPKTDFRGMGLLGLENLLFFAKEYNGAALHLLSHSHHPQHGYTFAIVGINLTSLAYRLLRSGTAKSHIYNVSKVGPATLTTFHQFYCYLFYEFDRYWMASKPKSIMDFSIIHTKFEANIRTQLADENTIFKINLSTENI